MYLLKAQPGVVADGSEAVDLGQTPGDIVVLSAADTELASLAAARGMLGETFPSVRLANLMQLSHNASIDLYCEAIIAEARLVIVRLLGGKSYWPYGVEQIAETCAGTGATLVLLPGDDQPDPELAAHSTVNPEAYRRLWNFLLHGGAANAGGFLAFAASLIGRRFDWREPAELPRAGICWPGLDNPGPNDLRRAWTKDNPVAALVFYRALVQADNVAPIRALVEALGDNGVNCLPMYCTSLKDPVSAGVIESLLTECQARVVLNGTGFAVSTPGKPTVDSPLNATGAPVFQVVFSGGNEKDWRAGARGLSARDIAMNVALPEVDGRILSRAVSFKGEARFDESTQCSLVAYEPVPDRIEFVARLAASWLRLGSTPVDQRRLAIILANYPNRDGRLGNGVGLDTPASVVELLRTLERAGYRITDIPRDGDGLIERVRRGPTNAATDGREISATLKLPACRQCFDALPQSVRELVNERWGEPQRDPFYLSASHEFALPAFECSNVVIGLQPARGYNIDPQSTYHDPDLVPPHGSIGPRDENDDHPYRRLDPRQRERVRRSEKDQREKAGEHDEHRGQAETAVGPLPPLVVALGTADVEQELGMLAGDVHAGTVAGRSDPGRTSASPGGVIVACIPASTNDCMQPLTSVARGETSAREGLNAYLDEHGFADHEIVALLVLAGDMVRRRAGSAPQTATLP